MNAWLTAAARALRREPEALFLALLWLLSGLVYFFGAPFDNPIQALLPHLLVTLWYAELGIGGALRICGLLAESPKLDLAGCLLLGTASLVYGSATVYVDGPGFVISAAIIFALSAACFIRAWTYIGDARRGRGSVNMELAP
jgi:hypothetical protein